MRPRLEKDYTIPEDEGGYTIPNNYGRLDEIEVPPPVGGDRYYRRRNILQRRPSTSHRNSRHYRVAGTRYPYDESPPRQTFQQEKATDVEEGYTVPESYGRLDELAAPSPMESRHSDPHDSLENRLSLAEQGSSSKKSWRWSKGAQSRPEETLTELATPAPIQLYTSRRSKESHALYTSSSEEKHSKPPIHHEVVSQFATQLYTVSYLILFSLFGTLARLGLQALTFYPGTPVQTGLLWCNFAGSLIMGFLSEDQQLFREHFEPSDANKQVEGLYDLETADPTKSDPELRPFISAARKQATSKAHAAVKKTIPLYIGLATGFCGSFTSFSSFMRDSFLALSNALPVPVSHASTAPINTSSTVHRNGGYSFMAICAVIILTIFLCIGALVAGAHLAIALEPITPRIPHLFARKVIDRTMVIVAWGAWLGAILMAIWPPDRPGEPIGQSSWAHEFWRSDALFALVFAPVGCLFRFYASLHLNGIIDWFPLGTFVVNIFGTAMEGMFYDLQHVPLGGRVGCQVLQGLLDGFCGCLTTVSTWVAELNGLRMRHGYIYGAASVGVGISLMVVIMGSLQWTTGFSRPLCSH